MSSGGKRPGTGAPKGKPQRRQRALSAQERLREKIRAGMLVARVQKIGLGEVDEEADQLNVQVRASLGLLRKVLPDLETVQVTGHDGGPLEVITRAE